MIKITHKGSFSNIELFLNRNKKSKSIARILEKYGQRGVDALSGATPVDSGETAASWSYEVEESDAGVAIRWLNSHVNDGVNIAVILQYGHGTGTGGYVEGRDYINPTMQPIFDEILNDVWREVTSG